MLVAGDHTSSRIGSSITAYGGSLTIAVVITTGPGRPVKLTRTPWTRPYRILRSPLHDTFAYIHENPVRRGFVEVPETWRWSGAGYYVDGRELPLIPDVASVPPLDRFIR